MKNTLQINIGLTTASNTSVGIHLLLQDLRAAGLYVINSRIALGCWQGVPECTLVAECLFAVPLCHPEAKCAVRASLARVAARHDQTCVAILWPDSTGELVPDVGAFDPLFFHPADRVTFAETAGACDADKEQLFAYLTGTLIPDLEASGDEATAEDFKTCIRFMSHPSPARDKIERIQHELNYAEEMADNIACSLDNLKKSIAIVRNPEITSGW